MEQYKKEKIFENNLTEFDDARYTMPSYTSVDTQISIGLRPKSYSGNIKHVKVPTIYHM